MKSFLLASVLMITMMTSHGADVVDPGLVITPPAVAVYPKFELSQIHIGGDATKGQRIMTVIVPLFEVATGKQSNVWSYTFKGQEYNAAQAAFTSDAALFLILCQKVGGDNIDLSKIPQNQTNVVPAKAARPSLPPAQK